MRIIDLPWKAFGWNVKEIDGHNMQVVEGVKYLSNTNNGPSILIAHTVKDTASRSWPTTLR